MPITVSDVLECAESARANDRFFLSAELLQLAEQMLDDVDHEATALSRLAVEAIADRLPLGAVVGDVCRRGFDDMATAMLRHSMLEGDRGR